MQRNMGKFDRGARLVLAVLIVALAFGAGLAISPVLKWAGLAVALIFAVTAVAGTCPAYGLFGIKTCRSS